MPTYEYRCRDCGEPLEVVQSFSDEPLVECPSCGGSLRKVFGAVGISFKGSGFYKTDSRKTSSGSSSGATAGGSDSSSTNGSGSAGDASGAASGSSDSGTSGSSGSSGSDGGSGSGAATSGAKAPA
ncbi:MAG TPA: FmdB family zinc ribbon protein [Acidimicrobiales bacterium]|nr:FmdB family zinc ribbon protein [Acidimicrobiales bacterium]